MTVWLGALVLAVSLSCGAKKSTAPAPEAVSARVCAACHAAHAQTYRNTTMGRSFYRATPDKLNVEDFTARNTLHHKASDRHYRMIRRGDRFFLRRWQTGLGGQESNVLEKEIHYVMGSGSHARSYIHRTPRNRLLELPVAWYPERGGFWAMSPGYDRADHPDFRRRISYDCMFCHNGYPNLSPGETMVGSDALFPDSLPEGIDCQRCHGAGRAHVEAAQSGVRNLQGTIVNPARLPPARQIEVCMQCHLETTSFPLPNVLHRFGRGAFSYKPGEPLGDFAIHFDHAPGSGHGEKFEIVNAAYRLRQAPCFVQSRTMLCTTCHNPHRTPRGAEAVSHYKSICNRCHGDEIKALVAARRHPAQADCIPCHMPKRRTEDVIHAVMTDHKIQRRAPPDPLAARPEKHTVAGVSYVGEVALYYPAEAGGAVDGELYVALAQVVQKSNLKRGLPRFESALRRHRPARPEFYHELGQAYFLENHLDRALEWFGEALARDARFVPSLASKGAALLQLGRTVEAVEALEAARRQAPLNPSVLHELARAYQKSGRGAEAAATARAAVDQDADFPQAHNTLGGILFETGDRAGAEQAHREAIRHQPDYAEAHTNLANDLHAAGDSAQALFHYRKAVELDPSFAVGLFGYGAALAAAGKYAEAEQQVRAALRHKPEFPEALDLQGNLESRRGDWRAAAGSFRRALSLNPDYDRAHLGLGTALAAMRDLVGAEAHLRQAAASANPMVRQEAVALLEEVRRGAAR